MNSRPCAKLDWCRPIGLVLAMHQDYRVLTTPGKTCPAYRLRMFHGLCKSWDQELKEEASPAQVSEGDTAATHLFAHEGLDTYRSGLEVVRWFNQLAVSADLPPGAFRQLDKASTALVLNIAEGNGRRSKSEHARFLRLAFQAGMRAATYLDLLHIKKIVSPEDAESGRCCLRSAVCLVRGLTRYLDDCGA